MHLTGCIRRPDFPDSHQRSSPIEQSVQQPPIHNSEILPLEQKKRFRVLVADDEKISRMTLGHYIKNMGYELVEAVDGEECIEILEQEDIDILLLDIYMPKKDGFDVMTWLNDHGLKIPVIMVTASHDIPKTVKCIKMGAFEYLTKPLDTERLKIVLRNALSESQLHGTVRQLQKELKSKELFQNIIGQSAAIRAAMEQALQVMDTELNVLILGESGTGKELFAQAIHKGSRRKKGPFISVNCAAISHELAESLLFGHVKGAFTGANSDHSGFFEQADRGTLFLDEIGDMNADIQAKVLRAIQEKKIRRVGEKKERTVDFRVISATNRDFSKSIENKEFRDDLYYRLEEYPLSIPPLRKRKEDIPLLAKHFLDQFCNANNFKPPAITQQAVDELMSYNWPGNVRELKNAVQRTAIRDRSIAEITSFMHTGPRESRQPVIQQEPAGDRPACVPRATSPDAIVPLEELERTAITEAYHICDRNPTKTAQVLGIGRATLYRKLKKFGIN
ncbi:sigma-54-dependent Fis family transcriptional regulator [Prosthecochloris sp. HL-130-GSB]|jgi:DNA-binding NtrC family response regulator|nr:sigma-54-dependent Fis family transcriptional regulator [Prosthecochloris sp. HL-130-GSB]